MMSAERFEAERAARWGELDAALRRPATSPSGWAPTGVRRLGELYRAAAADLAFARRRVPRRPAAGAAGAAGPARAGRGLRARRAAASRCGSSWPRGYWQRLAERPWLILAAWALLMVPALLGALWAVVDAPAAAGLIPAEFAAAADPPAEGRDFDAATAVRLLGLGHVQQHPGDAARVRGRDHVRGPDRLGAVLQRADPGRDRRAGDRRRQRRGVPAADLLARAAGDLVHRRRRDRGAADGLGARPAGDAAARRRRCGARRSRRSRWRRGRCRGSSCAACWRASRRARSCPCGSRPGSASRCWCCSGRWSTSERIARAFARRYAATSVAGSRSGGASMTRAPAART